jgi:YidC/Oxa1 family membrane protein insertase
MLTLQMIHAILRVDGVPSLGWEDTIAFLILPVFLVVSQYVSMELMQPKTTDQSQQQSNAILKVLPIMIGWFSLSVPAALSVYWVVNNIVTTATSLWIRSSMSVDAPKTGASAGSASATMQAPSSSIFTPLREKPAGFGERVAPISQDGVKPITAMDAEIVDDDDDEEVDEDDDDGGVETPQQSEPKKKRRKSRKKKKN